MGLGTGDLLPTALCVARGGGGGGCSTVQPLHDTPANAEASLKFADLSLLSSGVRKDLGVRGYPLGVLVIRESYYLGGSIPKPYTHKGP